MCYDFSTTAHNLEKAIMGKKDQALALSDLGGHNLHKEFDIFSVGISTDVFIKLFQIFI